MQKFLEAVATEGRTADTERSLFESGRSSSTNRRRIDDQLRKSRSFEGI